MSDVAALIAAQEAPVAKRGPYEQRAAQRMRHARAVPQYQNPLSTSEQILDLSRRYAATNARYPITEQHCLDAGQMLLQGMNERSNLKIIFDWKLQAFAARFSWVREWPSDLLDDELSHALIPARRVNPSDRRMICHSLRSLSSLPDVGIPVASAILMAMHPNHFTVIDRQAYKSLKVKFCDPMPPQEYLSYLDFCREQSSRLGVTLRQYDQALWQMGSDAGRSRQT